MYIYFYHELGEEDNVHNLKLSKFPRALAVVLVSPAQEHCYAAPENVQLRPLRLHRVAAFLAERSAALVTHLLGSAAAGVASGFTILRDIHETTPPLYAYVLPPPFLLLLLDLVNDEGFMGCIYRRDQKNKKKT